MACPHVSDDRINGGMDKRTIQNVDNGKKDRRILLVMGVVALSLLMVMGVIMLFHLNDHHQLHSTPGTPATPPGAPKTGSPILTPTKAPSGVRGSNPPGQGPPVSVSPPSLFSSTIIINVIPGSGPSPPTPTPPPTETNPWYPDWARTSTCANDGLEPSWMSDGYMSSSHAKCCATWFWWQGDCMDV